jgi:16S rRNA processing protein RimM
MILVGFIARTHGNKGEVILKSETDFGELRFRIGATIFGRRENGPVEPLQVTAVRFQQGRPILGIAGFSSISEAEQLAGTELRIPASEQDRLPADTYYHHQLIGCEVMTSEGATVGRVSDVQGDGAASRLVVRSNRGEVLIPLAQEICRIDVDAKKIVVTPPAGLLEVNGEWR